MRKLLKTINNGIAIRYLGLMVSNNVRALLTARAPFSTLLTASSYRFVTSIGLNH